MNLSIEIIGFNRVPRTKRHCYVPWTMHSASVCHVCLVHMHVSLHINGDAVTQNPHRLSLRLHAIEDTSKIAECQLDMQTKAIKSVMKCINCDSMHGRLVAATTNWRITNMTEIRVCISAIYSFNHELYIGVCGVHCAFVLFTFWQRMKTKQKRWEHVGIHNTHFTPGWRHFNIFSIWSSLFGY